MLLIYHPGCSSAFLISENLLGKDVTCPYDGCRVRIDGGETFTERHWLTMTELAILRQYAMGLTGSRKERLFGVACCRKVWHLLTDERSRAAVEAVERVADGLASPDELFSAHQAALAAVPELPEDVFAPPAVSAPHYAACAARDLAYIDSRWSLGIFGDRAGVVADQAASALARDQGRTRGRTADEQAGLPALYREIVGNPFRHVTIDPAWRKWGDGTVSKLAETIYDERAFERMPILADALEDAGCDNADVLAHCRQPGEHVRGCWVVDLLLSKD
jgi:hypothetical protein